MKREGRHTKDELLERCEDVNTPGHLDLIDLELEPLGERAFGRHVCWWGFDLFGTLSRDKR